MYQRTPVRMMSCEQWAPLQRTMVLLPVALFWVITEGEHTSNDARIKICDRTVSRRARSYALWLTTIPCGMGSEAPCWGVASPRAGAGKERVQSMLTCTTSLRSATAVVVLRLLGALYRG